MNVRKFLRAHPGHGLWPADSGGRLWQATALLGFYRLPPCRIVTVHYRGGVTEYKAFQLGGAGIRDAVHWVKDRVRFAAMGLAPVERVETELHG